MILLNVTAFGPSLVTTTERLGPLTWLVAAHGVIAFASADISDAGDARRDRTDGVYRRFGMAGLLLAAVMIVLTYAMSIETARRGYDLSGDLQRFEVAGQSLPPDALRNLAVDRGVGLALNVSQVVAFGILVGAGFGTDVVLRFTSD